MVGTGPRAVGRVRRVITIDPGLSTIDRDVTATVGSVTTIDGNFPSTVGSVTTMREAGLSRRAGGLRGWTLPLLLAMAGTISPTRLVARLLPLLFAVAVIFAPITVLNAAAQTNEVDAAAQITVEPDPPYSYVEQDSVRVVYWGDNRPAALQTLRAALDPIPMPGITGAALLPRATVYLPPDPATFDSLASGAPHWAAGVAIPSALMIVIPPGSRSVGGGDPSVTLRHEIAHLAVHRHLGERVPRWFDEGYATWVSGGWDESTGWIIRLALLRGSAPPLDSLTLSWPRGESRARLAYLLSASAVRHLATSRGDQAFTAFIAEWRRVGEMEPAMRTIYQISLTQFEREWQAMVRRRYGWLLAISHAGVFWGAAALLVFGLGTLRRKRNREKLEELRREEYMLPASTPDSYDGVDPGYPPE